VSAYFALMEKVTSTFSCTTVTTIAALIQSYTCSTYSSCLSECLSMFCNENNRDVLI